MIDSSPGALVTPAPCCLWLTGLPGSGKSTLASAVHNRLVGSGIRACVLDGDAVRTGLCRDLGYSEADRIENIRRVAEVAKLMVDAGLVVLVALISPYRRERGAARALFAPGRFVEIFVDAPAEVCEGRDPKGLYARARRGEIPNFTGIDGSYQPPGAPELILRTAEVPLDACVRRVLDMIAVA
jgi:adenylyl-sulfate kinase